MDDDFDGKVCEICFLQFNKSNNLPKIIECCNYTFCLDCLIKIYNKNNNRLMCSICRKFTDKNPINLLTNMDKFANKKPTCPNCKKETEINNLIVNIHKKSTNSKNFIFCSSCEESISDNKRKQFGIESENFNNFIDSFFNFENNVNNNNHYSNENFDNISITDYFQNLKVDLKFFSESNLKMLFSQEKNNNTKKIEEELDMKIMNFVDVYFEKIKKNLKSKIKYFMKEFLLEEMGFNFEMEREFISFNYEYGKSFQKVFDEINSISTITADKIETINKAIKLFVKMNEIQVFIDKLISAKSFVKNLSLNFAISNLDNFENLLINNLLLKQNNDMFFSNVESYAMKNSTKEFKSGIDLVDNEFQKLKSTFENYFEEFSINTKKNEELKNQLNGLENRYRELSNNFANILNENILINENNKKNELQLADMLVKAEISESKKFKKLEEKLKEKEVLIQELNEYNTEIKKQLEITCKELTVLKKDKWIIHTENEKLKNAYNNVINKYNSIIINSDNFDKTNLFDQNNQEINIINSNSPLVSSTNVNKENLKNEEYNNSKINTKIFEEINICSDSPQSFEKETFLGRNSKIFTNNHFSKIKEKNIIEETNNLDTNNLSDLDDFSLFGKKDI